MQGGKIREICDELLWLEVYQSDSEMSKSYRIIELVQQRLFCDRKELGIGDYFFERLRS